MVTYKGKSTSIDTGH